MFKRIGLLALLVGCLLAFPTLASHVKTETGWVYSEPLDIYFFCGGPPGGTFATVVYDGARAAADILGDHVRVHYVWSDWNPHKMVSQFQEAVAANPDGICVMGHPGSSAQMGSGMWGRNSMRPVTCWGRLQLSGLALRKVTGRWCGVFCGSPPGALGLRVLSMP